MTLSFLWFLFSATAHAEKEGARAVWKRGAIRVNTTVSSGATTIREAVAEAAKNDLDFIVITDQFQVRVEYGVLPFRQVLKAWQQQESVRTYGIEEYLEDISEAQAAFPGLVVIPGVDVAPVYVWDGSPIGSESTIFRFSEQISVIGPDDAAFYRHLPMVHNERFGLSFPHTLIGLLPLLLLLPAWRKWKLGRQVYTLDQGGAYRIYKWPQLLTAAVLLVIGVVWTLNNRPLKKTLPFHQYRDFGVEPYQMLIDYVHARDGALCFWSAAEAEMKMPMGRVLLHTLPYDDDVLNTTDHNGFAALYADTATAYHPGKSWDKMLHEYLAGTRRVRPVIIGEVDFHGDRNIDMIVTVVQTPSNDSASILDALAVGRSYAVGGEISRYLDLQEITLSNSDGTGAVSLGDTLDATSDTVHLRIRGAWSVDEPNDRPKNVYFQVILNGEKVATISSDGPLIEADAEITLHDTPKQYVRVLLESSKGRAVVNPIFVSRSSSAGSN